MVTHGAHEDDGEQAEQGMKVGMVPRVMGRLGQRQQGSKEDFGRWS